jgi:hypothetical protein
VTDAETPPEPIAGLVREHRLIESTVSDALAAVTAAMDAPADADLTGAAFEQLWMLQALLEVDLTLHIEKEERVLFPVMRAEAARLSELVDLMIGEHDKIKAQRALLFQTLNELEDDHPQVEQARADLRAGLDSANGDPAAFMRLHAVVERLDWLFQGHFTGEEDGIFTPAEDLLSADAFADMAARMAALESPR